VSTLPKTAKLVVTTTIVLLGNKSILLLRSFRDTFIRESSPFKALVGKIRTRLVIGEILVGHMTRNALALKRSSSYKEKC